MSVEVLQNEAQQTTTYRAVVDRGAYAIVLECEVTHAAEAALHENALGVMKVAESAVRRAVPGTVT